MAVNKVVNGYEFVTYSVNQHFQLFFSEKNHKNYPMHYHNAIEITMPLTKPYGCTGEQGTYVAQDQEILFIGSGILHCVGPLKGQEGGSHYTLLVDTGWLHQFQAFQLILEKTSSIFVVCSHMEHYSSIRQCLFSIYERYDSSDPYKDIQIASEFLKLIPLIAWEIEKAEKDVLSCSALPISTEHNLRQEILFSSHYIQEHCTEDLTLESMSRMLGISNYYYHRKFKEICHLSFHDHLISCRMSTACHELKSRKHSIEEIAHLCGYKSVSSFIQMFKQIFKMTPTQYRKNYQEQE